MAKDNGGGGAFGWTVLGFVAGVAATLGLQVLLGGDRPSRAETRAGQIHITAARGDQPAKPAKKTAAPAASGAAPTVQSAAEVADDAAATGMTSRVAPTPADTAPAAAN
jgi:hypothetical protein